MALELSADYQIRINRCPTDLKPNYTCKMQVQLKKFRDVTAAPDSEMIVKADNFDGIRINSLTMQTSPLPPPGATGPILVGKTRVQPSNHGMVTVKIKCIFAGGIEQIILSKDLIVAEDFDFNAAATTCQAPLADVSLVLNWESRGSGKSFMGWMSGPAANLPNIQLTNYPSTSTSFNDSSNGFNEWVPTLSP